MESIIQALGKEKLIYHGSDGTRINHQFVWAVHGNFCLSIICYRYYDREGYALIVELTGEGKGIPHPFWKEYKGKPVELRTVKFAPLPVSSDTYYDVDELQRFMNALTASGVTSKDFVAHPGFHEEHKRYWGGKQVDKLFEKIPTFGPVCPSPAQSIYSIRYPEDLHGWTPVAIAYKRVYNDWFAALRKKQVSGYHVDCWLILTKPGLGLHVDYLCAKDRCGYGLKNPVKIEELAYPPEIYDFIFHELPTLLA